MSKINEVVLRALLAVWADIDDMVERAGWTALQTFLALVMADGANWAEQATWKKAAIAAIAAGVSALKSAYKQHRELAGP